MADRQFNISINFQVISKELESVIAGLKKVMASTNSDINNVSKSVQSNITSLTKNLPKAQKTLDDFAKTIKPVQVSVDTSSIQPIKGDNIIPSEGSESVKTYNKELEIVKNNLASIMHFKPWESLSLNKEQAEETKSAFNDLSKAMDGGFVPSETLANSLSNLKFKVLDSNEAAGKFEYGVRDLEDATYLINKELKESANVVSSESKALNVASTETDKLSDKEKTLGNVLTGVFNKIKEESPGLYNDIVEGAKKAAEASKTTGDAIDANKTAVEGLSEAKQEDTEQTEGVVSANEKAQTGINSLSKNLRNLKTTFPSQIPFEKYNKAIDDLSNAQKSLNIANNAVKAGNKSYIPILEQASEKLGDLNARTLESIKTKKLDANILSDLTKETNAFSDSVSSAAKESGKPQETVSLGDVSGFNEGQKEASDLLQQLYDKTQAFGKIAKETGSNVSPEFESINNVLGQMIGQLGTGGVKVINNEQLELLKKLNTEMDGISKYSDGLANAGPEIEKSFAPSIKTISDGVTKLGTEFSESAKIIEMDAREVQTKLESLTKRTSDTETMKGVTKQIEANKQLNKEWGATTDLMKDVSKEFKALPSTIKVNEQEVTNLRNAFYKFRDEPTVENLKALQNAYIGFESKIIGPTKAADAFNEKLAKIPSEKVESAFGAINGASKDVAKNMEEITPAVSTVESGFSKNINKIKDVFGGVSTYIKDTSTSMVSGLGSLGTQIPQTLNKGFTSAISGAKTFAQEVKGSYSDAITNYGKETKEANNTDLTRLITIDKVNDEIKELGKIYGVNTDNVRANNVVSEETLRVMYGMDKQTNNSIVSLKSLGASTQSVSRALRNMGGGVSMLTFAIGQSITMITQLGSYLAKFSITATQVASNLDLQIRRIMIASGESYESIRSGIFEIANVTGTATDQVAEAFRKMIFAGIDYNTTMEVLKNGILVATASAEDFVTVVKLGVSSLNVFHKNASQLPEVFNSIYVAASKSPAAVQALAQSLEYLGPVAASMGISLEEITAVLTVLSQRGIEGSKAGTAMRRVLTEMAKSSEDMIDALHVMNVYAYEGELAINGITVSSKDLEDQMKNSRKSISEYEKAQIDLNVTQKGLNTSIVEYDNAINLIQAEIDKLSTRISAHQKMIDSLTNSYRNIEYSMTNLSDSIERYNGLLGDTRYREEALSKELEKRLASAPEAVKKQYEAIVAGQEKIKAGAIGSAFTSATDLIGIKNQLDATAQQREGYEDIIGKLENQRLHQEMILKTIQEQNKAIVKSHQDIIYSLEKETQLREVEITSLKEQSQNMRDLYAYTENSLNVINTQIEYQNALYEQSYKTLTQNNFEMRNGIDIIMDWSAAAQGALGNAQKTSAQLMAELTNIFGLRGVESITALFDLSSMLSSDAEGVETLRTQIEVLIDEMLSGGLQTKEQQILMTSIQAELNRAVNDTTKTQLESSKAGITMFQKQQEGVSLMTKLMDKLNTSMSGLMGTLQKLSPILLVVGDSFRTLTFLILTLGRVSTVKGLFGGNIGNQLAILEIQSKMGGELAERASKTATEIGIAGLKQKEAIETTKKFWLGLAKPVDVSAKNIGSTIGKMAASSKASLLALGTTVSGTFKKVSSVMVNSMNWSAIKPSISLLGAKLIPSLSKIGKLAAGELLNIWAIVPKMLMGGLTSLKFAFSGVTKMIKTQLLPTLIPLTPILAGIGIAIALVIAYKKNWLGIQDKLSPVVDNFRWIIGKLWEGIKWLGTSILNVIKGFNDWVKSIPGLVTALKILLAPITLIVKAFELINGWIANMRLTEEAEKIDSFAEVWDECNKEIGDTIPLLAGSKVELDENGKSVIKLADNIKSTLMAQLGPKGFGLYSNTLNNWVASVSEEYNKKIEEANAKFKEGTQERLNAYKEIEAAFMKTMNAMSKYLENTMLYADKEWQDKMAGAMGTVVGNMQNIPSKFILDVAVLNDEEELGKFNSNFEAELARLKELGVEESEAMVGAYSKALWGLTGNTKEATDYINKQISAWASSPELQEAFKDLGLGLNDFLRLAILGIDGLDDAFLSFNETVKNSESFNKSFANAATQLSSALAYQFAAGNDEFEKFAKTYITKGEDIKKINDQTIPVSLDTFVSALEKAAKDGTIEIDAVISKLEFLRDNVEGLAPLINSILPELQIFRDGEKAFKTLNTAVENIGIDAKKIATGFTPVNDAMKKAIKLSPTFLENLQRYGKIVAANTVAVDMGARSKEDVNKILDIENVRLKSVIDGWVKSGKVTKEEAISISEDAKTYIGDITNATLEAHAALLEQLNTKYADLQKNVDDGLRVIDQMASDGENVDLLMVGILSGISDDAWGNFLDIIKNYPQLLSKFGDEMIRMQTGLDPFTSDLYESTEAIKSNENALRTLVMAYEAGAPWAQKYMDKLVPSSSEIKAAGLFNRALSTTIDLANQFEFKGKEDLINGLTDVNKKLEQTSDSFEKDLELIKEISKISPVTGMTMAEKLMKGANTKEQAKIMYEVTQSIKESANMLPDLKTTIDKMSVSMEHATVGLDKIVEALYTMGYLTEEDKKVLDPYIQDTKDRAEEILKTSNGIKNAFAEYGIIAKDDAVVMKNISDEFVKIFTTGKDITKMSDKEFIEMIKLTGASDDQKKAVIELKDQLGYSLDNWKAFASLNPEIQKALLSYLASTDGVNRNFQNFMNSLSQDLVPLIDTTSAKILTNFLGTTDYAKEATLQSINYALNEIGISANSLFGQFISALPEKLQGPVGQFIGSIQAGIQKISPEISYWLLSGVTKATEGARGSFVELLKSLRTNFSSFGEMLYSMLSSVFDELSKSNSLTSILSGLNYKNINANIGKASNGFLGNMMQQVVNVNCGNLNFPDISSFAKWLQTIINGLTRQMDKTASAVVR